MVARWSANPLGMLCPAVDAMFVTSVAKNSQGSPAAAPDIRSSSSAGLEEGGPALCSVGRLRRHSSEVGLVHAETRPLAPFPQEALHVAHNAPNRLSILDDWGPEPMTADQRRELLEIVGDRYGRASTLPTSQLPVSPGTTSAAS